VPSLPRLLQACHPQPTAAVTTLSAVLAASVGAPAAAVAAAALSGQLSVGWSNDWLDAERDRVVGRADKPVAQGLPVTAVRAAALAALVACVPLSLLLGPWAGGAHLLAVGSAWAYNARLKSTVWSWAPYALSFGLLPSVVTASLPGHPFAPLWGTAAGALLGVGAHGANVLPDLEDDRANGVRGLPQRLGRRGALVLSGTALLLATAALATGPGAAAVGVPALVLAAAVFAAGVVAGRRPGSRAPFLAVLVVAALDVGLLLAHGTSLA
jgi:4-hydroxybenzoate polyprenyltransferase